MAEIFVMAEVPEGLMQAWLQHLRDFDVAHPGCEFRVLAAAPGMTVEEMQASLLEIEPGFPAIWAKRWAKGEG